MKKKLAPAEGRRVRKPDGELLLPEGETVEFDSFWRRRWKDKDVVEIPATKSVAKAAKPE